MQGGTSVNLSIFYLPITELTPYVKNTRKHAEKDVRNIKKSIEDYGMNDPIGIWSDRNIIVEGHGRFEACKQLGMTEVPCIRLDHLTDKQRREYAIAHNATAELSEWDFDILAEEIVDLDLGDFDFGFVFEPEEEGEAVEDDYDGSVPAEAISKPGDIWQLGRHRLMCGDSTDASNIDMLMDGNKADMVMTDPPYGIDVVGDNGEVGANFGIAKKGTYSKVIADDTTDTAKASYEILQDLCNKLIIWGGNYFLDFLPASDGWLIWDKRVDSGIRNTFADGEMAYCSFHTPVRIYHQLWNGMIREGEKEKRVHPTQKPIKMLSSILTDFTKEEEIVVDVFGGSGSTLIACEQLNRTCYMMELDPKYCDVIIKRWETLTGKKAVLINE